MVAAASPSKRVTLRSLSKDVNGMSERMRQFDEQLRSTNSRLDRLEEAQRVTNLRLDNLEEGQRRIMAVLEQMNERQHGMMVLLEQMDERNRATIEAVFSIRDQLQREIQQTKTELGARIDVLEIAVKNLSLEVRKHSEILAQYG